MLVVVCGAELFTGNSLLIAPLINKDIKITGMLKNWGILYIGNFIGAVVIAVLVVFSHAYGDAATAASVATAAAKCNLSFGDAMLRGILAFVVCGFEHSIANMYYITSGLMTSAEYGIVAAGLNFGNGLLYSLLPSTLGNIIGGGLIAVAYWAVYFKREKPKDPQQ